jgi:hypothetical protein
VHHGQNDYCIDKNYGGIFSIWDRMFGTYADERADEPPMYGVRKPLHSWNPVWGNVHHYFAIVAQARATAGWRNKLMCFFAGPGWQPPEAPPVSANFEAHKFVRFATPAPQLMHRVAMAATVVGTLLLMYFLFAQKGFTPVQRISFSTAMVLVYGALGYAWLHPRVHGAARV